MLKLSIGIGLAYLIGCSVPPTQVLGGPQQPVILDDAPLKPPPPLPKYSPFKFDDTRLETKFSHDYLAISFTDLLADISKRTGVHLTVTDAYAQDMSIASITDKTYAEFLNKFAEHFNLEWRQIGPASYELFQPKISADYEAQLLTSLYAQPSQDLRDSFRKTALLTEEDVAKLKALYVEWLEGGSKNAVHDSPNGNDMHSGSWHMSIGYEIAPDRLEVARFIAGQPIGVWRRLVVGQSITFSTKPRGEDLPLPSAFLEKTRAWLREKLEVGSSRPFMLNDDQTTDRQIRIAMVPDFSSQPGLFADSRNLPAPESIASVRLVVANGVTEHLKPNYLSFTSGPAPQGLDAFVIASDSNGRDVAFRDHFWDLPFAKYERHLNWLRTGEGYPKELRWDPNAGKPKDYSSDPVLGKSVQLPQPLRGEDSADDKVRNSAWNLRLAMIGEDDPLNWTEAPLRIAVAKSAGCCLISDAFDDWGNNNKQMPRGTSIASYDSPPAAKTVGAYLDAIRQGVPAKCELRDGWLSIRSENWPILRRAQVPRAALIDICKLTVGKGAVSLDKLGRLAAMTTEEQFAPRTNFLPGRGHPNEFPFLHGASREMLRVWHEISNQFKSKLLAGEWVSFNELPRKSQLRLLALKNSTDFGGGFRTNFDSRQWGEREPPMPSEDTQSGIRLSHWNYSGYAMLTMGDDDEVLNWEIYDLYNFANDVKAKRVIAYDDWDVKPKLEFRRFDAHEYTFQITLGDGAGFPITLAYYNLIPGSKWSISKPPKNVLDEIARYEQKVKDQEGGG